MAALAGLAFVAVLALARGDATAAGMGARREQRKLPYRGGRDPRRCPLLRWARARARVQLADGGDAVFVAFGVAGIVALGIAFWGLREVLSCTWNLVRFEHRVV